MAWTASEPLNRLLLVNAPALVLSPDGAHMLWANPSGATRLGAGNLESLLQEEFPESLPLRRQISHLFRWLRGEHEQVQRLRLGRSAATPLDMVRVRKLRNLDGIAGVLLQPVANVGGAIGDVDADALTGWLASGHHYAALLSADGEVISASGAFHDLRKAAGELQALLDTAYDSPVPVSRHLNVEAGIRHLVTAYKMPFGGSEAFLLLVDAEEISLRRNVGAMPMSGPMSGDLINVPKPANDTEPVNMQQGAPEDEAIDLVEESSPAPKTQVTLEDVQLAIENAVGSKVDIDKEDKRAEPPKTVTSAKQENATTDVMRFVWRMDDGFKFTFVSPEFQVLVGLRGAFEGRSWQDIAGDYQLDPDKKVQAVISSKDMWGGQRITWALPKRKARAEIELSAMPVFDDERKFQGYRGFGSCRLEHDVDILKAEKAIPEVPSQDVFDDALNFDIAEAPVVVEQPTVVEEPAEELPAIIDTRQSAPAESLRGLTSDERKAFEEIGRTLGHKNLAQKAASVVATGELEAIADETEAPDEVGTVDKPIAAEDTDAVAHQELDDALEPAKEAFPRLVASASTEAELKSILDRLNIGVLVVREDRLLYANKHLAHLAGYSDTESYLSAKAAAAMGGFALDPVKNSDGVMKFTGMNNITHSVRATIGKIDWMGRPASLLVVDPVPEQTDTILAQASVAGSEAWNAEELLAILNTATEGVLMINARGKVLALNHGAEALFGESQEVLKGRELTDLLAPESHKICHDYLQSILGAGVASVLNDGRDVIGRTTQGGYMLLFMTMGRVGDQPIDENTEDFRLCVVLRDITQWKRAEDDLIAARHNAEKANTAKSDFLAKISHEIRTPLNAILGFSEVIMEERFGPIGNPRYKDYISDIHTSGAHVINLVNDMLDISKIEAGQLDLSFTAVDLGDVLKECVALMQPQANEARVIIRTSLNDDLPRVVADAKTIRQIALNLLSNSIKFTAEGGQVIVSAVLEKDGDLVLRVRDTGIGMNEVDIATAMEPFRQVDSANAPSSRGLNSRTSGGTGLGLPLTKALVEANRAEFSIESTPAKGTLIRAVFPNTRVLAE